MLSVVLPTYNEALNIAEMVKEVRNNLSVEDEIIVVDDNSPDDTAGVIRKLQESDKNLRLIVRTDERGLTTAIQKGIVESKGETVIWLDCDLSQPPSKIKELMAEINSGCDVVVGSRYVPGGSDIRAKSLSPTVMIQVVLSFTLRVLTSFVLWSRFADWSSGYIAIKKSVVDDLLPLQGDYGEYFIVLIYRALKKGYTVKEIPYTLIARERGESKTATNIWGLVTRGVKYLATVFKLRFGMM